MADASELPADLHAMEVELRKLDAAEARINPRSLPYLSMAPADSDTMSVRLSTPSPTEEERRIAWSVLARSAAERDDGPAGWTEVREGGRCRIDLHWPRVA
jgi:hypothetical protein